MMTHKKNQIDKSAIVAAQSQAFLQGTAVWVPSQNDQGKVSSTWTRGVVEGVRRGTDDEVMLSIILENGETKQYRAAECFLQNEKDDTVDDLVRSDFLHEPGILHTLRARYDLDTIYTYSGQILIAVNPYKSLNHLYGQRMMDQYKSMPFGDLSPHTYAVAEAAYNAMMIDEKRQAILISGESGAGKTESAKMVMQYLAHRSGPSFEDPTLAAAPIEQQILESNPLLEAFGNAKTARNDNSSRFGKFVEIEFDMTGRIRGASISTYLLERSRVVSIAALERSFHIFYQLCSGSNDELKAKLHLPSNASDFDYLAQSEMIILDGIDDKHGFDKTLNAMRVIGLDGDQIESVLKCVASILHLGNIKFQTAENARADEAIVCPDASSTSGLQAAADLLGASPQALQKALMSRVITIAGEKIEKKFTVLESVESRDSLAKSLYSRLFDWLVLAVNQKIGSVSRGNRTNMSVGILDIYGFESFETNSFEQLCINLANEKLQQAFNSHIFKAEQSEYAQEGIDWSYIEFIDNQDVLDLLEGTHLSDITKRSLPETNMGVFPMIDEACRLPKATSQGLATSLRSKLEKHPRFSAPKRDQYSFVINHYAGEVRYVVDHLLEKNRDFKVEDQESLMRQCNHPLPATLYPEDKNNAIRSSFKLNTIGSTFRAQLNTLSETLSICQPHFIRCIKPNESSLPGDLIPAYAMEQLRAGGVLEAVRIACAGYPTRKLFFPFAQRYWILVAPGQLRSNQIQLTDRGCIDWQNLSQGDVTKLVKMIMAKTNLSGWQIGKTRIFLRTGQLAVLEGFRGRVLTSAASCVQKHWRGYNERKKFQRIVKSVNKIQTAWRSYVKHVTVSKMIRTQAATLIQAVWRMWLKKRQFIQKRKILKATIIQSYWRMYLARKEFIAQSDYLQELSIANNLIIRQNEAAILIQAYWRRQMSMKKANILSQNALKFSMMVQENEDLKQELIMWKEKYNLLDIEFNHHKSNGGQIKSTNSFEAPPNLNDALQDKIRLLNDSLEQSFAREKSISKSIFEERKIVLGLKSDLELYKMSSRTFEDRTIELGNELAEANKVNKVYVDTITALQQSNISKTQELHASTASVENLQSEIRNLKDRLLEQQNTISKQQNEIAMMSSRIESLLKQVDLIEQEKAGLSRTIVQMKEKIMPYSQTEEKDTSVCTSAAVVQDMSGKDGMKDENQISNDARSLDSSKADIVNLYIKNFIYRQPVYVNVHGDNSTNGSLLPFSSWILRNCVNHWVEHWKMVEVDIAIDQINKSLCQESKKSLKSCVNSINTMCASGAMLKVDAVGRRNSSLYVRISERLMNQKSVYSSLGTFISRRIPINVSALLTEDARRSARNNYLKQDHRSFEDRLDVMGSSKTDWKSIIGSLVNLSIDLKEDKLPNPLVKSALWATLRYIDGSILNGILMRRDLCSVSSAKALLTALGILEGFLTSLPGRSELSTQEYRESFKRVTQAAHFIIEGFNDCSRKARSGVGIKSSILKCSALTLQQIYRLAESQHDDWLSSAFPAGSERKTLLEALKSMLQQPMENELSQNETCQTELEQDWVIFGANGEISNKISEEHIVGKEDFQNLLVDPLADFNLNARGFHRRQMILNSKMYFQAADTAANAAAYSTVFSKIEEACSKVPIPESIHPSPEMGFPTD